MKHVPGSNTNERPLEEQAEILTKMLAGHQIFLSRRGTMARCNTLADLIDPEIDVANGKTPSSAKRDFKALFGDLQVLLSMMAKLKRNHCFTAAYELKRALQFKEHQLWCENVPFEKTIPVTLVMFSAKKMLEVVDWELMEGNANQLDAYFEPNRWERVLVTESTKHVVEVLPSLAGTYFQRNSGEYGYVYKKGFFRAIAKDLIPENIRELHKKHKFKCFYAGEYGNSHVLEGINSAYDYGSYLHLFKGEQKEVLSIFPRNVQCDMASWQLRLHPTITGGTGLITIALYPEVEHSTWTRLRPSTTSKGVSFGFGAIVMPEHEFYAPVSSYSKDEYLYSETGRIVFNHVIF